MSKYQLKQFLVQWKSKIKSDSGPVEEWNNKDGFGIYWTGSYFPQNIKQVKHIHWKKNCKVEQEPEKTEIIISLKNNDINGDPHAQIIIPQIIYKTTKLVSLKSYKPTPTVLDLRTTRTNRPEAGNLQMMAENPPSNGDDRGPSLPPEPPDNNGHPTTIPPQPSFAARASTQILPDPTTTKTDSVTSTKYLA